MKTKTCTFIFAIVVALGGYNLYSGQQVNQYSDLLLTDIEAVANDTETDRVCKWKMFDCPGWGTGDYEACLVNGDGFECPCGSISRNCP